MRKNELGFTLIELLAVITIMGILMLVAIPAVTRTIENSRRDTFADIAHEYINAVRNGILSDNIECYDGQNGGVFADENWRVASANPEGVYYFPICTVQTQCTAITGLTDMTAQRIETSTTDLMEKGGKSPFGGAEMQGYVKFEKSSEEDTETGNVKTKIKYWIVLTDTGKHGIVSETNEDSIKRGSVSTATGSNATNTLPASENRGMNACRVS